MPSQLYKNEGISFVCAKNFKWRDTEYHQGDDFPQEEANNVETMVRSRFLIPVVDDLDDKPRHWHREVQLRDQVMAKLNQEVVQIVMPDQEAQTPDGEPYGESTDTPAPSEELPEPTQADDTAGAGGGYDSQPEPPESLEETYDPSEHNVIAVQEYIDEHPEQKDEVLAMERAGKNRKGLVEG